MKSKILSITTLTLLFFTAGNITSDSAFDMSTQSDRKTVSVTIYNGGIGLVRETRTLNLSKGIRTLRFEDVPSQIIPQTVRVKGEDPKKLTVFEQNYEYDLISQERLMDKYIGKEVTLHKEGKDKTTSVKATLIANNGSPVYKIGDEISLGYNGRVTVPTIPENLFAKPTLVWKLKNETEKEQTLEVSYQTNGLGWSADYILVLDKEENLCGLNSWVTLNNNSGAEFKNAILQLVAGKVNLVSNQVTSYAAHPRSVKKTNRSKNMMNRQKHLSSIRKIYPNTIYILWTNQQTLVIIKRNKSNFSNQKESKSKNISYLKISLCMKEMKRISTMQTSNTFLKMLRKTI